MNNYILDENDKPLLCENPIIWAMWFQKADRVVRKDTVGLVKISTVFLGIDHSFGGDTPILFETMIFGGDYDQYCERYSTKEQAIVGHVAAYDMVMAPLHHFSESEQGDMI